MYTYRSAPATIFKSSDLRLLAYVNYYFAVQYAAYRFARYSSLICIAIKRG